MKTEDRYCRYVFFQFQKAIPHISAHGDRRLHEGYTIFIFMFIVNSSHKMSLSGMLITTR